MNDKENSRKVQNNDISKEVVSWCCYVNRQLWLFQKITLYKANKLTASLVLLLHEFVLKIFDIKYINSFVAVFSEIQETHNKLTVGFTPLCLEEVCPCLLLWWGLWRAPPWRLRPDIPFYNTANSLISPLQNSETQHRYEKQIERNLLATESSLELSYLKTPIYTESLSRWTPWLTPLPDLALFDLLGLLLDDLFFLALLRRIRPGLVWFTGLTVGWPIFLGPPQANTVPNHD